MNYLRLWYDDCDILRSSWIKIDFIGLTSKQTAIYADALDFEWFCLKNAKNLPSTFSKKNSLFNKINVFFKRFMGYFAKM